MKHFSITFFLLLFSATAFCQNSQTPDWQVEQTQYSLKEVWTAGKDSVSLPAGMNVIVIGTIDHYHNYLNIHMLYLSPDTVTIPGNEARFETRPTSLISGPTGSNSTGFVYRSNFLTIAPDYERNAAGRVVNNEKNRARAKAFLTKLRNTKFLFEIINRDGTKTYKEIGPFKLSDVKV